VVIQSFGEKVSPAGFLILINVTFKERHEK